MPRGIAKNPQEFSENVKKGLCLKRYKKPLDTIQRFWSYVRIDDLFDCWEWTGALTGRYGTFGFNGQNVSVHRLSYQLTYGEIPEGLQINHKCNNPKCVNPSHLYAGTAKDNSNDMVNSDRHLKGERNPIAKLTEKQVLEIRANAEHLSQKKLANQYGVSKRAIFFIIHRESWKYLEGN